MAYDRINWQNEPSEATAVNNVNLNKMDSAIYDHDQRLDDVETDIDNKVDKVTGQGLSKTNDVQVFSSTNVGTEIATVQIFPSTGGVSGVQIKNGVVVDSALSSSSENPVQNKAINTALNTKVNKETGKGLSTNDFTNAYKTKLDNIHANANHVEIEQVVTEGTTLANITIDGTTTAIKGSKIEVDEELSPTSTNPVENKAIYDALNNLLPSKTVSGNPISISDASGFNAKALTVSMNPIQDLHGYDHPWAGGAGKNKYDGSDISNTSSGSAYTSYSTNLSAGTWTISAQVTSDSGDTAVGVSFRDNDGQIIKGYIDVSSSRKSATVTLDRACTTLYFYSGYSNSTKANTTYKDIQIESGSTATSYAPYSNICPISGRTEASVTRTGKNVFNLEKYLTENNITYTKDGEWFIFSIGSALYANKFTLPELGYYSGQLIIDSTRTVATNVNLRTYKNGSAVTQGQTFTNQQIDQVGFNYSTTGQVCCKVQTEYGASNTTYEPYTAETHTHQYGQTVYGGEDDFVNGGATSEYGFIEYDGTEDWILQVYSGINTFRLARPSDSMQGIDLISNMYATATAQTVQDGAIYFGASNLVIADSSKADLNDFKSALATNHLQIAYKLATPTTIQLSPEALTLLKGLNVISTDGDNMEMKYSVSLDSLLP